MVSRDDQLWEEVSRLLDKRPGWSVQDSPTPGAEPNWAFCPRAKVVVSVFVEGGTLYLYEEKSDRELQFGSVDQLATWLRENKPEVLTQAGQPRPPLLRWR